MMMTEHETAQVTSKEKVDQLYHIREAGKRKREERERW